MDYTKPRSQTSLLQPEHWFVFWLILISCHWSFQCLLCLINLFVMHLYSNQYLYSCHGWPQCVSKNLNKGWMEYEWLFHTKEPSTIFMASMYICTENRSWFSVLNVLILCCRCRRIPSGCPGWCLLKKATEDGAFFWLLLYSPPSMLAYTRGLKSR